MILKKGRTSRYFFLEQEFSVICPPPCWRYPLAILQRYKEEDLMAVASTHGNIIGSRYVAVKLPQANQYIAPSDKVNSIVVHNEGMTGEHEIYVEAVLHEDGTLFRSSEDFTFVTMFVIPSKSLGESSYDGEMYSVRNMPDIVRNPENGRHLIVDEMMRLYHNAVQRSAKVQKENVPVKLPAPTKQIGRVEKEVSIKGIATFKIYADKSVKVKFEDGVKVEIPARNFTIALKEDNTIALVTTHQGETIYVRSAKPIGYEW
ncbi:hypothetical protein HDV05_000160 [Chytridiales sp. JEL 0842]|nr:hypothetical protein HDV05_000160 [Chytridiales sp. JEL 0842]